MRVIVTGSRDMDRWHSWRVGNVLWSLYSVATTLNHDRFVVVHGGCPGPSDVGLESVDDMAHLWVKGALNQQLRELNNIQPEEKVYPADWSLGKAAGPIRNRQMARDGADLCVAFLYEPDGRRSRGTRSMIVEAKVYGIPVWSVTIT